VIWKKRWWPEGEIPREDMDEFISDLEFSYYGEDQDKDPEHGLGIKLSGGEVTIVQWDMTEPPDDEAYLEDWKENPVLKIGASVDLRDVMDPKAKHRQSYSGDIGVSLEDLIKMGRHDIWEAVKDAAIAYLAYHGGSEEWVSEVGE